MEDKKSYSWPAFLQFAFPSNLKVLTMRVYASLPVAL